MCVRARGDCACVVLTNKQAAGLNQTRLGWMKIEESEEGYSQFDVEGGGGATTRRDAIALSRKKHTKTAAPTMMLLHLSWPYIFLVIALCTIYGINSLAHKHSKHNTAHITTALQSWRDEGKKTHADLFCTDIGEILATQNLAHTCALLKTRYAHKGAKRNLHVAINALYDREDCSKSSFISNNEIRHAVCKEEHMVAQDIIKSTRTFFLSTVLFLNGYIGVLHTLSACITLGGALYSSAVFFGYMCARNVGAHVFTLQKDINTLSRFFYSLSPMGHKQD